MKPLLATALHAFYADRLYEGLDTYDSVVAASRACNGEPVVITEADRAGQHRSSPRSNRPPRGVEGMPTFTYQCELVTGGETLDLREGGEVVEHTDTDQGLRIWYRIPHEGTLDDAGGDPPA